MTAPRENANSQAARSGRPTRAVLAAAAIGALVAGTGVGSDVGIEVVGNFAALTMNHNETVLG